MYNAFQQSLYILINLPPVGRYVARYHMWSTCCVKDSKGNVGHLPNVQGAAQKITICQHLYRLISLG